MSWDKEFSLSLNLRRWSSCWLLYVCCFAFRRSFAILSRFKSPTVDRLLKVNRKEFVEKLRLLHFLLDLVCTVDEVKVDLCAIDRLTNACRLKRGSNYTMTVDFTPDFDGDDVTMLAYALLPGADAEFQGMDENACHWMKCPVVKGTQQTYTFALSMRKSYPRGMFNVRWLMKKAGEPKCCFTNKFKIE